MPTFTQEISLPSSAPSLWAALKDSNVLFPKIAPQIFASVDQPGDEKIGAVRTIKFGTSAPEGAYVKEKLTALDVENLSVSSEEVEGGHLAHGFTKWATIIKFIPIDDKSSKVHITGEYEGGSEAFIAQAKEGFLKVFTGLADYINSTGAYA